MRRNLLALAFWFIFWIGVALLDPVLWHDHVLIVMGIATVGVIYGMVMEATAPS